MPVGVYKTRPLEPLLVCYFCWRSASVSVGCRARVDCQRDGKTQDALQARRGVRARAGRPRDRAVGGCLPRVRAGRRVLHAARQAAPRRLAERAQGDGPDVRGVREEGQGAAPAAAAEPRPCAARATRQELRRGRRPALPRAPRRVLRRALFFRGRARLRIRLLTSVPTPDHDATPRHLSLQARSSAGWRSSRSTSRSRSRA